MTKITVISVPFSPFVSSPESTEIIGLVRLYQNTVIFVIHRSIS